MYSHAVTAEAAGGGAVGESRRADGRVKQSSPRQDNGENISTCRNSEGSAASSGDAAISGVKWLRLS